MVRRVLLWFHRYLGLLATIPLILLGLSGAVLVFEVEIDRALNPTYWNVSPQGERMAWQDVVRAVSKAYPHDAVTGIRFPEKPTVAAEVSLKSGLSLGVDPYTGRVLGARRRGKAITTYIHQFHTRLLSGIWLRSKTDWGGRITGFSTIAMLVLAITGLILWWRRKSVGIKWNAPWRRVIFDAHYAFGFWGLAPLLFIGLTGVAIGFESVVRPALYSITQSHPAPMPDMHSAKAIGPRLTIDAALGVAHQALPGAEVSNLGLPTSPSGVFLAFMKFPEDHTPAGRSRVGMDQYSGKILWLENAPLPRREPGSSISGARSIPVIFSAGRRASSPAWRASPW